MYTYNMYIQIDVDIDLHVDVHDCFHKLGVLRASLKRLGVDIRQVQI